jgi:hypothetical protein
VKILNISFDVNIFDFIDGLPITTTYNRHDAFKDAYHLHDLRFAVTLWKKEPGETAFRRYDDIQYISQISTEDKNCKKNLFHFNHSFFSLLDRIPKK